ncbi:unnamed protein product [Adineta steineri]|uniref:Uncharacterized protein n=1 Tax=Adineta steineri TaxID=433720 RepID=A0A815S2D6_9BILA|nr:unnamed protein product [Adineta steineri]CAF1639361.1 unnamed protein product [Adineta steineri]
MVKKKPTESLFSTLVRQINTEPSSAEYHLIDNEYFATFNSINDIQEFHNKLIEKQPIINTQQDDDDDNNFEIEQNNNEMNMKSFAEQFLIDLPESLTTLDQTHTNQSIKRKEMTSVNSNIELNHKRQRQNIRDLPQSSNFIFMSDDDNEDIFNNYEEKKSSSRSKRIAYEDMSSILLTLDIKQKKKKHVSKNDNQQPTIAIELAEPSIIKNEPTEQEHLVITHVTEAKEEPVELNVIPTGPMGFGTPEYSGDLDNYVQNIHRSCSTNVSLSDPSSLRPKRIRKRKKFYIEESESVIKPPRRIRKKPTQLNTNSILLTDAEIEQQFGERLSPTIKCEYNDEMQQNITDIAIVPQTPIEKARAKLTNALERGHGPDTFLLKIRSRESRMIEIELAIYGTADWHSYRTKVLSKIEEALRGLRVSWTKIDIRVDDFDVQICTSPQAALATPPSSLTNANSSWFLKALSEFGPLIVHIHDRRYPHQRKFVKCPCPQCPSNEQINESSLPIIVSVSPAKIPNHRLSSPTILRKTHSSLNSFTSAFPTIHIPFFKELIHQYGMNTMNSVTQCVLDLTLITSVHSSLSNLLISNENYPIKYQQIINPFKSTNINSENLTVDKSFFQSDILTFYQNIKQNQANIRNAQSMKNVIFNNIPKPSSSSSSNIIKTTTLILPKPSYNRRPLIMNRSNNKRYRNQIPNNDNNNNNNNGIKQQAHFTPIIELKPILGGSTLTDDEPIRKVTKIISTNTIQKDSQRFNTITTQEITPRVIRLSITKPSSSIPNSIRLVSSTSPINRIETSPLVPKQINIIKPFTSSSIAPAIKLSNPILISNKSQQSLIK